MYVFMSLCVYIYIYVHVFFACFCTWIYATYEFCTLSGADHTESCLPLKPPASSLAVLPPMFDGS